MTDPHYSAWTGEGPKHADTDPDQAEIDRLRADKAELIKALEHTLSHDAALKPEYQLPASLSWELRETLKRAKAKGK